MPEEAKITKIEQVRPPNPFDFSSICDFLEQVLGIGEIIDEYSRIAALLEQKANEKPEGGHAPANKISILVFDEDQFEEALVRAFIVISGALIKFKSLSPREQELKREFLAQGNDSSLRNALTSVGFPESFGKTVIGKTIDEVKPFKLTKALHKANSVFDRAFYFQLKETELTKKSIEELVTSVRTLEQAEDVKQYLESLLYKVEVASTEKSFINLKKLVAVPLNEIYKNVSNQFVGLQEGRFPEGKGPYSKDKMEAELGRLSELNEVLGEYCNEYFCNPDFIYVEKNLLQFKKAKAEQQDHNSKCLLSDEFSASIEKKLIIQLIQAFKKCYNIKELWMLKYCILVDLVGKEGAVDDRGEPTRKFTAKKNLSLEALKRIRTDMIVEDTFTTATENKKGFIENFEKELFQFSPKQLASETLVRAQRESEETLSRAKRQIHKKSEDGELAKEEAVKAQDEIDYLGSSVVRAVIDHYLYSSGKVKVKDFTMYKPRLDPHGKYLEQVVRRIENPKEKESKKTLITEYLLAYQQESQRSSGLDNNSNRIFQMYLKGLIERIRYW